MNSKMKHIIFLADKYIRIFSFSEEEGLLQEEIIDLPNAIFNNGRVEDSSHLIYLLKKYFEDNQYKKENLIFLVQSTDLFTKSLEVPLGIEEDELNELIDNEIDEIFVQDLNEYHRSVLNLSNQSDKNLVIISIIPKELIKSFEPLTKNFKNPSISFLAKDTLYISYLNKMGKGQIWKIDDILFSFYRLDDDLLYAKNIRAEALNRLFLKNKIMYTEIPNILEGKFDSRITNLTKEEFSQEFYHSLRSDINFIELISDNYSPDDKVILSGLFFEKEDAALKNSLIIDKNYSAVIKDIDLAIFLLNHENSFEYIEEKQMKKKRVNIPLLFLILGLFILAFSYFYGQNLNKKNNELMKKQEKIVTQDENNEAEENFVEDTSQISSTLNQLYLSKPEEINLTSINFENNIFEVNGQVENSEVLDNWINELEKTLNVEVLKEPSTSIDGLEYFRFTMDGGQ